MIHYLLRWTLLFGALFIFACSDSVQHLKKTTSVLQPENVIPDLLNDSNRINGEDLYSPCALEDLYLARHNNPMWFKKDELTPQGDTLLYILHHANYYGLAQEDYHVSTLDQLNALRIKNRAEVKLLASLDILMTDGLLALANHIHYGRVDKDRLILKSKEAELDSSLWNVMSHAISKNHLGRGLEMLEPQNKFYHLLKNDLKTKLDSLPLVL
ncbi:MAG TPA: hypothetical protein VFW11_17725, partial [Cyclobacteriaceae bacterium]|nr:hypothetical protein [Cyclobacteriaceae bacterium]